MRIIKIVANCQILRVNCAKCDFGWGSSLDPAGGAHSTPPGPRLHLRGPTSKGGDGEGEGTEDRERGKVG